jgi:hypothetical protein
MPVSPPHALLHLSRRCGFQAKAVAYGRVVAPVGLAAIAFWAFLITLNRPTEQFIQSLAVKIAAPFASSGRSAADR